MFALLCDVGDDGADGDGDDDATADDDDADGDHDDGKYTTNFGLPQPGGITSPHSVYYISLTPPNRYTHLGRMAGGFNAKGTVKRSLWKGNCKVVTLHHVAQLVQVELWKSSGGCVQQHKQCVTRTNTTSTVPCGCGMWRAPPGSH